jgi:general secretion pathway protein F/type IV pilus assembly protein PilC
MAIFRYFAINDKNRKIKGYIDADNLEDAKYILGKKQVVITDILEFESEKKKITLSKSSILNFTEEMSKLLAAGLPLYEALFALKDKYENHAFFPIILDLCDQIKRGKNFSQALAYYPKIFDFLYCSMVANAEKTGSFSVALDEISKILKRAEDLKKKLISALLYPAILMVFCFIVIFTLIFFVIPTLFELFEGKNLHPLTKIVLFISQFANAHKTAVFSSFASFILCIVVCFKVPSFKKKTYAFLLNLPILKKIMLKVALIRFSRAFSVLLDSGVSYVEALSLSKEVMNHPILEKDISEAEKKIIVGEKLSEALKKGTNIPRLIIRLLEVAEESAKTSAILLHIAGIYEDELDKNLTRLTTILQPILLLILGGIVGLIVLSVLIPLTDVSSFVG